MKHLVFARLCRNNFFYNFIYLCVFFSVLVSCKGNRIENTVIDYHPERAYFSIEPVDRMIEVPIRLNDQVTARMMFDTGAMEGSFCLDSTFCVANPDIIPANIPDTTRRGTSWGFSTMLNISYKKPYTITVGDTDLTYNSLDIANWRGMLDSHDFDGVFGFPKNDSTHIWELNFENNYLEIHSHADFIMPDSCYLLSLEFRNSKYFAQFPLHIKCADGDTVTINGPYLLDTGMPFDIALLHNADELNFFNKKKDAVWSKYLGSYRRHYTTDAVFMNDMAIDSLRIYTFDKPNQIQAKYLIGLHFFKHFNVYFDLKNRQMGLKPIDNFYRIINPMILRFHYSTTLDAQGKSIVREIADNDNNYYKTAGLSKGDEIVAVNGEPYKKLSYDPATINSYNMFDDINNKLILVEDRHIFKYSDILVFDVIREGKPIKITITVDPNEEQGE